MLVKIAAFIGERDCELNQKKWDMQGKLPFVSPASSLCLHYIAYSPLSTTVSLWKFRYDDPDMTKEYINEIIIDMKRNFVSQLNDINKKSHTLYDFFGGGKIE